LSEEGPVRHIRRFRISYPRSSPRDMLYGELRSDIDRIASPEAVQVFLHKYNENRVALTTTQRRKLYSQLIVRCNRIPRERKCILHFGPGGAIGYEMS